MFFKVHEEAELPGVTSQDLEDILVSVRASSRSTFVCFLLSFSFHVVGGFVSRRQVCCSESSHAGHSPGVGDHSQGLRPLFKFSPGLRGALRCPEDCELSEHLATYEAVECWRDENLSLRARGGF